MRGLLIFMLGLAQSASATVVFIDNIEKMTKQSDVVIHAAVADQSVKEDAEGRITTLTTLEILDGIKGARTGDLITLYQVGGALNGRVMRVSGAQHYHFGEELVLFGVKLDNMIVSYGVGLGKFKVLRGTDGTKVVEDLNDLVEAKPGTSGNTILQEPKPRQFASLDAFKGAIRDAIALSDRVIAPGALRIHGKAKSGGAR